MSTLEEWQENNTKCLAKALAGLRERLSRAAPKPVNAAAANAAGEPVPARATSPATPPPAASTISRSALRQLLRPAIPETKSTLPPPPIAPAPAASEPPPELTTPVAEETLRRGTPWSLEILADRFGLSAFEQNLLLLAVAPELDTRISALCARAQDDPQKPYPTFALALAIFDDPAWEALGPERPLRYLRLIEAQPVGLQPLTSSPLRADERIVNYLKGLNHLDERLTHYFAPWEFSLRSVSLSPSQQALVDEILTGSNQAAAIGPRPPVQLVGPDPVSKQLVAMHVATHLQQRLYRVNAESLPAGPADQETLVRLWQRESSLLPLALYFDAEELGSAELERTSPLCSFLARTQGLFFVGLREPSVRLGRTALTVDVAKPTAKEQQEAWQQALGDQAADDAAQLAAQFNLNLPAIEALGAQAKTAAPTAGRSIGAVAWDAARTSERPRLDALAQRLDPKMTWDDLVLPKAEIELLRQIAAQVAQRNKVYRDWGFDRKMNRGFGISALFAGDSGTGKTMAAEVIAQELRLSLYRIDLSQVVNKYIGETEKNLRRLFDAAEDSGAILFFDEADALFGKRSAVKDSHDRYANIEINYLLQRMESYRGLAILATNTKSALDLAFLRRLRFIVNFHFPLAEDRRRLWTKAFMQHDAGPEVARPDLGRLDYDRLAALNLTGGHIHNVALNAAFLAAQRHSPITMPIVLEAARTEFRKLDRQINEAEFKWTEPTAPAQPVPVTR